MNKLFTDEAWKDYVYWMEHNKQILQKINRLIKEIERAPFQGIGKPEGLRYSLQGFWSRRIDAEHRLVYKVEDDSLIIVSCRYRYF